MSDSPETRYTEDHEWGQKQGDIVTIGITDYAQEQLGDVVYVELPEVGDQLEKGADTAVVESVKAAGDVKAPVSGEVVEINDLLEDAPETVNASPEDEGWFYKLKVSDDSEFSELKTADDYKAFVEGLVHCQA